jgi:pimeloyl-ACP methyl ester carboxylesterase
MHRLMTEVLGYPRFIVAGGDGGSAIAQSMAIQFPDSVLGVHLTDIGWHANAGDDSLSDIERKYVDAAKRRFMKDGAYRGRTGLAAARARRRAQRFTGRARFVDRRPVPCLGRFAAPSRSQLQQGTRC